MSAGKVHLMGIHSSRTSRRHMHPHLPIASLLLALPILVVASVGCAAHTPSQTGDATRTLARQAPQPLHPPATAAAEEEQSPGTETIEGRLMIRSAVGANVRAGQVCRVKGVLPPSAPRERFLVTIRCGNVVIYTGWVRLDGLDSSLLGLDERPSPVDGSPLFRWGLSDAVVEDVGWRVELITLPVRE